MIDLLDLHTHTIASGHAYNTLYEMAQSAAEKGLALYGCSEHAPAMPGSCHKFYFSNFDVIPRVIRGIPVLMGTELNILDHTGRVDLEDHYLQKNRLRDCQPPHPLYRQSRHCIRLYKCLSGRHGEPSDPHHRPSR